MLATSKNVLFPGHNHHANHRYWWPFILIITWVPVTIKVSGHQYRWLAWWLWPGNRTYLKVASMVVTWWRVAFFPVIHTEGISKTYWSCSYRVVVLSLWVTALIQEKFSLNAHLISTTGTLFLSRRNDPSTDTQLSWIAYKYWKAIVPVELLPTIVIKVAHLSSLYCLFVRLQETGFTDTNWLINRIDSFFYYTISCRF